jgi:hypothetical protein
MAMNAAEAMQMLAAANATPIRGEQPVRLTTFADGVRDMVFTERVHRCFSRRTMNPDRVAERAFNSQVHHRARSTTGGA